MNTIFQRLEKHAHGFLRIGMALVFLWFGTQQLINVNMWVGLIPQSIIDISHLSATTLVHFNGAFELVFGIALLLGFCTRVTALLLGLHLISITLDLGYGAIAVRDFGLAFATLAIFMYGADAWSLDSWLEKRNSWLEKRKGVDLSA